MYLGHCINRLAECAQLVDYWAMRFPVRLPLLMTALPLFNVPLAAHQTYPPHVDCCMGSPLAHAILPRRCSKSPDVALLRALLEDLLGIEVLDMGLIAQHLVVGLLQQLRSTVAQL